MTAGRKDGTIVIDMDDMQDVFMSDIRRCALAIGGHPSWRVMPYVLPSFSCTEPHVLLARAPIQHSQFAYMI